MEFEFLVKKEANFYYFLHNLANLKWPWPARMELVEKYLKRKMWPQVFEKMSEKEKRALLNFKKISQKYFLKVYLGKFFFLWKNPWKELKKKLSNKDVEVLKKAFFIFKEKFNKEFLKVLPKLLEWKRILEKETKKSKIKKLNDFLEKRLSLFYRAPSLKKVKVFLVMNDFPGFGGERGRGLDGKSVFLEICGLNFSRKNLVFSLLWHEVIQGCYSPHYFFPFLKQKIKNEKLVHFAEEIQIRSLFPGYLGKKLFNVKTHKTLGYFLPQNLRITEKKTKKLIELSKQYWEKEKAIDEKYIKKFLEILKIK